MRRYRCGACEDMTIDQALHTVNSLKPHNIERARLIDWLDRLDRRIFKDVISTHDPDATTPAAFDGYDQNTDPDTVLLIPPPYDEAYRFYLEMEIDLTNREYESYNNNAALYAAAYGKYARAYHREHRPLRQGDHLRF